MGVMSCCKPDCESIMCDTYVEKVGYVCAQCQEEFKVYMDHTGPNTEGMILDELIKFMSERKSNKYKKDEMSVDDFFKKYTK